MSLGYIFIDASFLLTSTWKGDKNIYSVYRNNGDAGVTQLARVPAFQADCCGFEPRHPLHWLKMIQK